MNLDRDLFLGIVRNTPLVSIDLIVRNAQGEVLVGLRNNEPARDSWFVPGGRILKDERIGDAFRRISLAELGIERSIDDARFVGVYEHLYDTNFATEPGVSTHYVVLAHELTDSRPSEALPPLQHRDYRWALPHALLEDPTVHANTRAYFQAC